MPTSDKKPKISDYEHVRSLLIERRPQDAEPASLRTFQSYLGGNPLSLDQRIQSMGKTVSARINRLKEQRLDECQDAHTKLDAAVHFIAAVERQLDVDAGSQDSSGFNYLYHAFLETDLDGAGFDLSIAAELVRKVLASSASQSAFLCMDNERNLPAALAAMGDSPTTADQVSERHHLLCALGYEDYSKQTEGDCIKGRLGMTLFESVAGYSSTTARRITTERGFDPRNHDAARILRGNLQNDHADGTEAAGTALRLLGLQQTIGHNRDAAFAAGLRETFTARQDDPSSGIDFSALFLTPALVEIATAAPELIPEEILTWGYYEQYILPMKGEIASDEFMMLTNTYHRGNGSGLFETIEPVPSSPTL